MGKTLMALFILGHEPLVSRVHGVFAVAAPAESERRGPFRDSIS
ncbi:MAG: hypothetical protein ABI914_08630 [Acidobacteriota bacterium]